MVKIKSRRFVYKNSVKWQERKKGVLSSLDKADIEVATPPEFRGHPGIWSPEDLFVASVNSCVMTTFLYYAEKENFRFLSYESEAEGILEQVENKFMFSEVKVMPKIVVTLSSQIEKARELIEFSKKGCLISNSIASKVTIYPEIKIDDKNAGF